MTLAQLIESARNKQFSPEDLEEQRVNFACGNAAEKDNSTLETVKAASTILKQTSKQ